MGTENLKDTFKNLFLCLYNVVFDIFGIPATRNTYECWSVLKNTRKNNKKLIIRVKKTNFKLLFMSEILYIHTCFFNCFYAHNIITLVIHRII